MLAAGTGAGAAIELNHTTPASSSVGSSLPSSGNGTVPGNGSSGDGGGFSGGNPFGSGGSGVAPGAGSGTGGSTNSGSGPLNATTLAAKVDPAVVDVDSTLQYSDESAEGTGMVISSDGLILTNNHVIDQATSITVTEVTSGQTYPAKVVGYDSTDDIAVLQVQTSNGGAVSGLKTITVGNSNSVKLGDPVLAIGNAGGRGGLPSTAQGIISAKNRSIQASDNGNTPENLSGMLQTNAPIQEGDSGGPLVNAAGAAIGIDTAANTSDGQSQTGQSQTETTGFAIPINKALSIAKEIIDGQASATVHLGEDGFIGVSAAANGQACGGDLPGSGSGPSKAVPGPRDDHARGRHLPGVPEHPSGQRGPDAGRRDHGRQRDGHHLLERPDQLPRRRAPGPEADDQVHRRQRQLPGHHPDAGRAGPVAEPAGPRRRGNELPCPGPIAAPAAGDHEPPVAVAARRQERAVGSAASGAEPGLQA